MKTTFLSLIFIIIISISFAQTPSKQTFQEFEIRSTKKYVNNQTVYLDNEFIYIPLETNNETKIEIYSLKDYQLVKTYNLPEKVYKPSTYFSFENGFIYLYNNFFYAKVDINNNNIVWQFNYESKGAAQLEPVVFDEKVGFWTYDKLMLVDKKTGEEFLTVKLKDIDQAFTVTDKYTIYGQMDKGKVTVIDNKTKNKLYTLKVGEQCGNGFGFDGDNIIFPSSDLNFIYLEGNTGKKIWEYQVEGVEKQSCGSGFNIAPTIIDDKLFAAQMETGLYVIDKNNGTLIDRIQIEENIDWEIILYKNQLLVVSLNSIYSVNLQTKEVKKVTSFPYKRETHPNIAVSGNKLCIYKINNNYEGRDTYCYLYDLDELIE
jgi:outer membrane protein assembly factor BamB